MIAEIDFETFSAAGFLWGGQKYVAPIGIAPAKKGLLCTGAWEYSKHPSTEILCLYYAFDGGPRKRWIPGEPVPQDLFNHILLGGTVEAHNWFFEFSVWNNCAHPKLGWPVILHGQMKCSAAKAAAFGLPRALEKGLKALKAPIEKDMKGNAVMRKLSVPRKPTKNNPEHRFTKERVPQDYETLYAYCDKDVETEHWLSSHCPELPPQEERVFRADQKINIRGVHCDREFVLAAIKIYQQAEAKYNKRLAEVTGGAVTAASQTEKLRQWGAQYGYRYSSLDEDHLTLALSKPDLSPVLREALEIRSGLGSNSVKKLFQMETRSRSDSRIRDIFMYCGAGQTGRWAGAGTQPQNMPSATVKAKRCISCGYTYGSESAICPSCFATAHLPQRDYDIAMDAAKRDMLSGDLGYVESQWGNACKFISACLRGMFCAAPGKDLICADYSAIEAVVLACLAGEAWRVEVFRTHGKIYEMTAAQVSGVPFEEILAHKERTGDHHPLRKTTGKVGELASGYQGGLGAWKNFGADKFMSDEEIQNAVKAWRAANPNIVSFWYNLEDAAKAAIRNPGQPFMVTPPAIEGVATPTIIYQMQDTILTCLLPSGRKLYYHDARLEPDVTPWGTPTEKIYYWRVDPFTKQWSESDTYGGKLAENVTQATARDVLANALPALEDAEYPIVLHVHDETVSEVDEGTGDVGEYEVIMGRMPYWAEGWPIRAAGGWRGKRYRKD